MRRKAAWVVGGLAVIAVLVGWSLHGTGFNARNPPAWIEGRVMLGLRSWAIPPPAHRLTNPIAPSDAAVREGMAHWADHCAVCHDNDGSGNVAIGRHLYPPAPDMRLAATQNLSDGDLFYIIEQGVPYTGMPGWGNGTPEGQESTWHLVLFIRHLPKLTPEELKEMTSLNPVSPADQKRKKDIDDFLNGRGH